MSKFTFFALVMLFAAAGASVAAAQQPVTLTSTADFKRGNNEGLISTANDRLTRDRITAGSFGAWSPTTPLPTARRYLSSVAFNGFVYAIGGNDLGAGPLADVLVAPILGLPDLPLPPQGQDNVGGSIGPWSATTALPLGRDDHTSLVHNGFLYVIGGTSATARLSDVLVARINADGSVGAWSATTALPTARKNHQSVAYNGFLYVIAGDAGGLPLLSDVLVAPIRADGSVGAWSATTALPFGRTSHSAVAYNRFLYVLGGQYSSNDNALVARINADGSVGAWSVTSQFSPARRGHTSVVYNGFVYTIGGTPSEVWFAPFNADGSIGLWTATSNFQVSRSGHASALYNGFVYTLGGFQSPTNWMEEFGNDLKDLKEALVAPIHPDSGNLNQAPYRLRGVYSRLVDLQGDTSTRFITVNGQLSPGGAIQLQVRVAPDATKVFGAETVVNSVSPGSSIEVPGTGRYVWIRLVLDDTGTSNVDQPTYVSDIMISPTASNGLFLSPALEPAPESSTGRNTSCAFGASVAAGSGLALLGGLVLLVSALRRKRSRDLQI